MSVDEIILWLMAIFMALGALDRIFGSRLGLGKQFEEGILAIGALALSMLGILSLAPVLARLLRPVLVPVYGFLGADPAMFAGTILANDMGGAPLAFELAGSTQAAQFGGLIVGAMLGAGDLPLVSAQAVYYLKSYAPLLVLGMLCATPLPKKAVALLREKKGVALALDVLEPLCVLLPLLIGTAFLVDGSFNPFLYFRF